MKGSGKGLFIIALLFAIVGAGLLFIYMKGMEQPVVVSEETIEVVVAKEMIPERTLITEAMLTIREVPSKGPFDAYVKTTDEVVGKYLRTAIYKDGMIHKQDILSSQVTDLSMALSQGERAVTVSVDGQSGVSKLIKVGDRVDVLVYLPQLMEQNRIVRPDVVKMILQNLEVLAIDQLTYYQEDAELASGGEVSKGISAYQVTLSVPVMQVEGLVLAKDIGVVDLALRPHEGDYLVVTKGVIWQDLLLNDFGNIKDLFPQYDIIGTEAKDIAETDYEYDQYVYYTVQYGDTLNKISQKFYGTTGYYDLIMMVNQIEDEDLIVAGTGLKVPILKEAGDLNESN